jgi:putative ABC transport system ATP-binding protein
MNNALIQIQQVSLKIDSLEKPILDNINYDIARGDVVVLLGSNGSGKSSLLKLIDRRYEPTKGQILLEKKSLNTIPNKIFRKEIITLTQNSDESLFPSLTVLENYLLVKQHHEPRLFALHARNEHHFLADYLASFNPNLPNKLNQITAKLSGGEKQALVLALAVLYPPKILLLDEHTSALDPNSAQQLMSLTQNIIQQHKITCILTTHDLDIAQQYGNRILALQHGKIFQQIDISVKSALDKNALLAACY